MEQGAFIACLAKFNGGDVVWGSKVALILRERHSVAGVYHQHDACTLAIGCQILSLVNVQQ